MNEWWWWFVFWGGALALGVVLTLLKQGGLAAGALLLALFLFVFGIPFAGFMDFITPCDGYDLEYVSDGWGNKPVCIDDEGVRFEP